MAGKPTDIIFNAGADLVIIPSPAFTRRTEIITGSASTSAPVKSNGVHSMKRS